MRLFLSHIAGNLPTFLSLLETVNIPFCTALVHCIYAVVCPLLYFFLHSFLLFTLVLPCIYFCCTIAPWVLIAFINNCQLLIKFQDIASYTFAGLHFFGFALPLILFSSSFTNFSKLYILMKISNKKTPVNNVLELAKAYNKVTLNTHWSNTIYKCIIKKLFHFIASQDTHSICVS